MSRRGALFTYRFEGEPPVQSGVSTSRTEIFQIGLAFLALTLALTFLFTGNTVLFGAAGATLFSTLSLGGLGVSAAAALTGFVVHELAHKVVAQRQGYWAEFRMSPFGLGIAVITAYIGFLWGAPGATVVSGMRPTALEDWGRTSLAGPMANLVFAVGFYAASVTEYLRGSPLFEWLLLLAWINAWFGTFNLFPMAPLDGQKVRAWNRYVWLGAILATGSLAAIAGIGALGLYTPLLVR